MKYGRWTPLREVKIQSGTQPRRAVIALCDCGTEREVNFYSLTSGRSISCGCHRVEQQISHGMSRTAIYDRWRAIKRRCTKPTDKALPKYGGRGIHYASDGWSSPLSSKIWACAQRFYDR